EADAGGPSAGNQAHQSKERNPLVVAFEQLRNESTNARGTHDYSDEAHDPGDCFAISSGREVSGIGICVRVNVAFAEENALSDEQNEPDYKCRLRPAHRQVERCEQN